MGVLVPLFWETSQGGVDEIAAPAPQAPSHPSPKQGAGAQPPSGVQRVPLLGKTLESGPGRITADATVPKAGCRGRSPRRGYRGSPPVSKNVGGWAGGTTAQAKPDPPLKEGAGSAAPAGATVCPPVLENVPGQSGRDSGVRAISPPPIPAPSRVQETQPPPGVQRVPLFWNTSQGRTGRIAGLRAISPLSSLPKAGCRGAAPAGGTGGVPLFLKTLEGGAGGIAAQAKPDPPLKDGAGHNKTLRPGGAPLLQNKNDCAILPPMKQAPGPLLFLGACRITYVLGANHRESPCGSASGETSPSPTTVRRRVRPVPMPFPDKPFGAARLRRGSLRFSYNCTTVHHSSLTAPDAFVTPL